MVHTQYREPIQGSKLIACDRRWQGWIGWDLPTKSIPFYLRSERNLNAKTSDSYSTYAILIAIEELGLTLKVVSVLHIHTDIWPEHCLKLEYRAKERSEAECQSYLREIQQYPPEYLVFLDEMCTADGKFRRRRGYCPRGCVLLFGLHVRFQHGKFLPALLLAGAKSRRRNWRWWRGHPSIYVRWCFSCVVPWSVTVMAVSCSWRVSLSLNARVCACNDNQLSLARDLPLNEQLAASYFSSCC